MKNKKNTLNNWTRKFLDFEWRFIEVLSLKIPIIEKHIIKLRKHLTQKECAMAEISSKDKVLVIGCGPHPTTALIIAKETRAQVVAIDKKIKAVKLASSYIHKNNLKGIIQIEYGDGIVYPSENFDVIFIAANVWPIDLVLISVFSKIKDDAKVIFRDFNENIKNIITNGDLSEICYIASSYDYEGSAGILISDYKSLLLKKRKK